MITGQIFSDVHVLSSKASTEHTYIFGSDDEIIKERNSRKRELFS